MTQVSQITAGRYFEPGRPPLAVVRVTGHRPCPLHSHEFSELVVVLRGTGLHLTSTGQWPIGAGDVFVLHGDQAHGYVNTADLDLVNILFSLPGLGLPPADVAALPGYHVLFDLEPRYRARDDFAGRLRLGPEGLQPVVQLIDRLEAELTARGPGSGFAALGLFMLLICELSRCFAEEQHPATVSLLRLGRVLSYLEQHYAEPLTLDDLAGVAHLSRRSLTRAFREAYGDSPVNYLLRLRLERACGLLRGTDSSVTEVAHAVGFSDSSYFTRRFRAAFGLAPRQWRQRQGRAALGEA